MRRNHWRLILATGVLAVVLLGVGFAVRAAIVDDRTFRLCERIALQTGGGAKDLKPGQPGYTYYREIAPDEDAARRAGADALAEAFNDCESFR